MQNTLILLRNVNCTCTCTCYNLAKRIQWHSRALTVSCQFLSTDSSKTEKQHPDECETPEFNNAPPVCPDRDWIGPVDKRSNLRLLRFAQRPDETEAERAYRGVREEVYEWNHRFWAQHNQNFIEAKEHFVKNALGKKGVGLLDDDGAKRVLSADEMAEFYNEFLQDNRQTLQRYNREWYRHNTALLWQAFKISLRRLARM